MTLSNLNMERSTLKVYTTIPIEACQHFKLRDLYLVAGLYINAPYKIGVEYMETNTTIEQLARTTGISTDYIKDSFIPKLKNSGYIKVVTTQESYPETRQRLRTLCGTNDGFRIAEADLQQRGPGDFFGSRQHGLPVFRVGDLATDLAVLRQAQEAAAQLISQDRPLPSPLAQAIESLLAGSADTLN